MRHQTNPNQSPSAIIAVPIPTIVSKAQCSIVFAGGRSSAGTESSPVTSVSVLKPTRNESRPGIPIPHLTPSSVQIPPMYSVTSRVGVVDALHRRELDRLVLGDRARGGVADEELDRGEDAADGERDQQAEPVVAVAAPAQHPDGVHRGDQEGGDQVGGEDHVRTPRSRSPGVNITSSGSMSVTLPAASSV